MFLSYKVTVVQTTLEHSQTSSIFSDGVTKAIETL